MMKKNLFALLFTLLITNAWGQSLIEVHKSPTCGCCGKWIEHLEENGFTVTSKDTEDMHSIKVQAGVPGQLASCHTAQVEGYFLEGHVPAEDVRRLLEEKPAAKGLTVPGMPVGSPGMEMGSRKDPYQVLLVKNDDTAVVFNQYPKGE